MNNNKNNQRTQYGNLNKNSIYNLFLVFQRMRWRRKEPKGKLAIYYLIESIFKKLWLKELNSFHRQFSYFLDEVSDVYSIELGLSRYSLYNKFVFSQLYSNTNQENFDPAIIKICKTLIEKTDISNMNVIYLNVINPAEFILNNNIKVAFPENKRNYFFSFFHLLLKKYSLIRMRKSFKTSTIILIIRETIFGVNKLNFKLLTSIYSTGIIFYFIFIFSKLSINPLNYLTLSDFSLNGFSIILGIIRESFVLNLIIILLIWLFGNEILNSLKEKNGENLEKTITFDNRVIYDKTELFVFYAVTFSTCCCFALSFYVTKDIKEYFSYFSKIVYTVFWSISAIFFLRKLSNHFFHQRKYFFLYMYLIGGIIFSTLNRIEEINYIFYKPVNEVKKNEIIFKNNSELTNLIRNEKNLIIIDSYSNYYCIYDKDNEKTMMVNSSNISLVIPINQDNKDTAIIRIIKKELKIFFNSWRNIYKLLKKKS